MEKNNIPFTVIGAGIVGVCCALQLQRRGYRVQIVDPRLGAACSFGNAGSISTGSIVPLAIPGMLKSIPGWLLNPSGPLSIRASYAFAAAPWLLKFVGYSKQTQVQRIAGHLRTLLEPALSAYQPLIDASHAGPLLQRAGQLYLYETDLGFAQDQYGWQLRREHGVPFQTLTQEEVRQLEPSLAPIYRHGVLLTKHAHITNPKKLLEMLTAHFIRQGGRMVEKKVDGFETDGAKLINLIAGGDRLPVQQVVIAAGAWSNALCNQLGSRAPLESQRGYHTMFTDPGFQLTCTIMSAERKFMATSMEDGLRIAGTVEFNGLAAAADWRRATALEREAARMFKVPLTNRTSRWMGHRPCMPDSMPVIGRSPFFRDVFFAFGHGHLGLTGAAHTGQLIAELAMEGKASIDLEPFRIDRFDN